jgi:HlyD family secretion protein
MNAMNKRWVGFVLGTAVLVALLMGLAGRQQAPSVSAVRVTREALKAWISSNGKVEPIQPSALRAQMDAFVQKVAAVEGQGVKRDQLLLELDATDARAQLAKARADLATAQDDLRVARTGGRPDDVAKLASDVSKTEANLVRLRQQRAALEQLVAAKAATPDELAQNQLALEQAQADWQFYQQKKTEMARQAQFNVGSGTLRIQQAQEQVSLLDQKVRSAEVIAPVEGTLYALLVHPGDYVHVGDLLAELTDLRRVRVRAFVDEPDLGWLAPDQAVEITWDAMPSRLWEGSTVQIPKQVVARGTRTVGEVLCSVDNNKLELLPNVDVNVRIRVRERQNALVVPRAVVRSEGSDRYVFVVDGGRLHRRTVQVGIASATRYEILQGLAEGDLVALPSDLELRDGLEVRAVETR